MPSLGEGVLSYFFTLWEYPELAFSTSKSCQSVCHTPQGSTYLLPPQPLTCQGHHHSHWGDGSHHSPCPIPRPLFPPSTILKSSSQSEVLKTQTGSC